jgi:hypothetical protein
MSKKFILSLVLAATAVTPAVAGGYGHNSQPSLLGVIANVGTPRALADVKANLLNNSVKADVKVGSSQPSYVHNYSHSNSSLADIYVSVPGIARIQADVGQQNRRSNTLLGISANVLGGGVGHR